MSTVTQSDIAKGLGVSQQAVAFAMSDRPEFQKKLRDETRRRILETAEQMGYAPHRGARSLRTGKTHTIVLGIGTELHHPDVHELIEEVYKAFLPHGYQIVLGLLHQTPHPEEVLRLYTSGNADGLVLLGYESEWLYKLARTVPSSMPIVLVGPWERPDFPSVSYDRVKATKLAVSHLLGLGHRRVAMVFDAIEDLPLRLRLEGYREALTEAGLAVDETLLFRSPVETDVRLLWNRIQNTQPRPTGIFCYNDELSMALLQVIHREGLRVPDDVALATLGNTRLSRIGDVPLTAVDMNNRGVAQTAAQILLAQMQNPGRPARRITVDPSLVVRTSTIGEKTHQGRNTC